MNDEAVYRTAPATPGLLTISMKVKYVYLDRNSLLFQIVRLKQFVILKETSFGSLSPTHSASHQKQLYSPV